MLFLPALFSMLFLAVLFAMLFVMLFLPALFTIFLAVQLVYLAVQILQPVEHIVEAVMHFLDGFCYGVFDAFDSFHRRLYNAFLELFYRIVFSHGTIIAWIS
jgi:nitrogen fixation/metabolism regulation signal transduction histidine kinase